MHLCLLKFLFAIKVVPENTEPKLNSLIEKRYSKFFYKSLSITKLLPESERDLLVPLCSARTIKGDLLKIDAVEGLCTVAQEKEFECPQDKSKKCFRCITNVKLEKLSCPDGCYAEEGGICEFAMSNTKAIDSFIKANKSFYKYIYSFLFDEDKKERHQKLLPEVMRTAKVTLSENLSGLNDPNPNLPSELMNEAANELAEDILEEGMTKTSNFSDKNCNENKDIDKNKDNKDNKKQEETKDNVASHILPNKKYNPDNPKHFLIVDVSTSIQEKYKNSDITKRDYIQMTLDKWTIEGKKINYCVASLPYDNKNPRVSVEINAIPPTLYPFSSYIGLKNCFEKIAELEKEKKLEVDLIYIIADKTCGDRYKAIKDFKCNKKFVVDLLSLNIKAFKQIRDWIFNISGFEEEIRILK